VAGKSNFKSVYGPSSLPAMKKKKAKKVSKKK
jgi:hypothetical protein